MSESQPSRAISGGPGWRVLTSSMSACAILGDCPAPLLVHDPAVPDRTPAASASDAGRNAVPRAGLGPERRPADLHGERHRPGPGRLLLGRDDRGHRAIRRRAVRGLRAARRTALESLQRAAHRPRRCAPGPHRGWLALSLEWHALHLRADRRAPRLALVDRRRGWDALGLRR